MPTRAELAEGLARRFHEAYEELAPEYDYITRKDSAVPWEQVPEENRLLMIATADRVLSTAFDAVGHAEWITPPAGSQWFVAVNEPGRHGEIVDLPSTTLHPAQWPVLVLRPRGRPA